MAWIAFGEIPFWANTWIHSTDWTFADSCLSSGNYSSNQGGSKSKMKSEIWFTHHTFKGLTISHTSGPLIRRTWVFTVTFSSVWLHIVFQFPNQQYKPLSLEQLPAPDRKKKTIPSLLWQQEERNCPRKDNPFSAWTEASWGWLYSTCRSFKSTSPRSQMGIIQWGGPHLPYNRTCGQKSHCSLIFFVFPCISQVPCS